jgi:hypothetical protein
LPRLADPQALVAWLYRIARDRAFGRLRKLRRVEQQLDERLVVDTAAADEGDFSPEDAASIHAALDELPPEQREVLVLRFLEDMTYEQIAGVVGCQLGNRPLANSLRQTSAAKSIGKTVGCMRPPRPKCTFTYRTTIAWCIALRLCTLQRTNQP